MKYSIKIVVKLAVFLNLYQIFYAANFQTQIRRSNRLLPASPFIATDATSTLGLITPEFAFGRLNYDSVNHLMLSVHSNAPLNYLLIAAQTSIPTFAKHTVGFCPFQSVAVSTINSIVSLNFLQSASGDIIVVSVSVFSLNIIIFTHSPILGYSATSRGAGLALTAGMNYLVADSKIYSPTGEGMTLALEIDR
jgi:hypothetical protein